MPNKHGIILNISIGYIKDKMTHLTIYIERKIIMMKKILTLTLATLMVVMSFTGCSSQNTGNSSEAKVESGNNETKSDSSTDKSNTGSGDNAIGKLPNLKIGFGPNGNAFTLHLYDNNTAAEIARHVGEADWNLPIYHFDDFENYEVMQYYDIPSRYKITSNPEKVTSEKAGEVYYSDPNRIIIFYQDAKVKGEFTKVGYLENTDGLKDAVEKNPVVPGWGNKIVSISPAK